MKTIKICSNESPYFHGKFSKNCFLSKKVPNMFLSLENRKQFFIFKNRKLFLKIVPKQLLYVHLVINFLFFVFKIISLCAKVEHLVQKYIFSLCL